VRRKITALWGEKKVVLRQTPRAVMPFGGLSEFIAFLTQMGFREQRRRDLPVHLRSPHAIDPGETFTAFLISVVAGARRFAHTAVFRSRSANAATTRRHGWRASSPVSDDERHRSGPRARTPGAG
jgi:hypothetical protein